MNLLIGFLAFAFSINLPFLANSFTSQYPASPKLLDRIISWYGAPQPLNTSELSLKVPSDLTMLLHPVLVRTILVGT